MSSGKRKRGGGSGSRARPAARGPKSPPGESQPVPVSRSGLTAYRTPAGRSRAVDRGPVDRDPDSDPDSGSATGHGARDGTAAPPPGNGLRSDSLVVGRTPPLARAAGALGAVAGIAMIVRPLLPLGTAGAKRIGGGLGVIGVIGWLPAALVIVTAGTACAMGRLPRLGLAVVGAAGGLGIGAAVHWLWLTDAGARTSIDLPVPGQAVAVGAYSVGSGLVVALAGAIASVLALVAAYVSWGATVMDDDGRFDAWRPAFGSAGLVVGALSGIAFGTAPSGSSVGAAPGGVLQQTGGLRVAELVFVVAVVIACVGAPTLRPRMAVVGAWLAVGVVLLGAGLENVVVVDRSADLRATLGTVAQPVAAVLVLCLALAAAAAGERRTTTAGRPRASPAPGSVAHERGCRARQ